MPRRIDDVHHSSYKPQESLMLKFSIECFAKKSRKTSLLIIDALGMTCNYQLNAKLNRELKEFILENKSMQKVPTLP